MDRSAPAEHVITTICRDHCNSSCVLKLHVRDGTITRIETDDGDDPQFRACQKGRASRQLVYHPDRLQYPLRRNGERGEGRFERISWDEALDTIAGELVRVKNTYGALATILLPSGGDGAHLNNPGLIDRVLVGVGGYTGVLGTVSDEGTWFAAMANYGNYDLWASGRAGLKSPLVILWGTNPAVTRNFMSMQNLAQLREAKGKFVVVDPKYTETAALFDAEWIPIRPGTDTAMLLAMAHVIISENLHDVAFLDQYAVGFEQFKRHVLGEDDATPKTPAWSEAITGVAATTIAMLAREYASAKPAALIDGFGPARTAYGEQFTRAIGAMTALTGNYAATQSGGRLGTNNRVAAVFGPFASFLMGETVNPAHLAAPLRKDSIFYQRAPRKPSELRSAIFYGGAATTAYLNRVRVTDAILRGREGGYPADYKLLYMVTVNFLNQYGNTNRIAQALRKLEFVVAQEQFMTPTAKFADIVLPTNTIFERNDLATGPRSFYASANKAIEPLGESRSQYDIARGLAERLGLTCFENKSAEEWLTTVVERCPDSPDYETLKAVGVQKVKPTKTFVPFGTPSGKIELYSQDIAAMNIPKLPPIPTYIETWESVNDPLAKKYPLQLITTHYWRRVHSRYENVPWLTELEAQSVLMNPADARARGIKDGDPARVFNDRGQMIIPALLSERILPGVVDVPEGGAYKPDDHGIDRGGCANVLTSDEPSPGGAFCTNTALVQVEKAEA